MVRKTIGHNLLLAIGKIIIVATTLDLWMSQGGCDIFV
jgi:hypothetical protein